MIIPSYKKTHIAALAAAVFVHGAIATWSLMPSDPVVINQQAIQVSFVAPSANNSRNEKISPKKVVTVAENKIGLKQKKDEVQKEEGEKNSVAGKETSGRVDERATTTRAAESEPIFNADYLNNPAPSYPMAAKRRGIQGKVLISVVVKTDGTPGVVAISRSSGSSDLDEAALDAVRQWKFVPAKSKGQFVQASVIVPVEFKLI